MNLTGMVIDYTDILVLLQPTHNLKPVSNYDKRFSGSSTIKVNSSLTKASCITVSETMSSGGLKGFFFLFFFFITSCSVYSSRIRAQTWRRARALAGTQTERQQFFKPSHWAPSPHTAPCPDPSGASPPAAAICGKQRLLSRGLLSLALTHGCDGNRFRESRIHSHWILLGDRLIVRDLWSASWQFANI